jgi:heptaprenylglyceryl phosphate synthase
VRGYRTIDGHEDLLRTQLQAIANAAKATTAEVWVMAPMVTLPGEAAAFVAMAREYGLSKAGVMIESTQNRWLSLRNFYFEGAYIYQSGASPTVMPKLTVFV